MSVYLPPLRHPVRQVGRRTFDFARQVAVMAIVNVTPDSFFDRGRTFSLDHAVAAAVAAVSSGAGVVDIGGVPFSAHTRHVSLGDELARVLPVVAAVAALSDVAISVDTFRAEVAERSIAAGATIINDTTGLRDPELAEVVAASGATLVITHSIAGPQRSYSRPTYGDVVTEVRSFLTAKVELAVSLGVPEERLVVDPGHDLNKTTRHSLELTRRLAEISSIGLPVLAAVSNKDFIGESTGTATADRLSASIAAATVCILNGARIIRMHDVAAAVRAATMVEAVLGLREPAYARHNMT